MTDTLYLHTDYGGKVWCGQDSVLAINTKNTPEDFVQRTVFTSAKRVYVFHTHSNLPLLLSAYEHVCAKDDSATPVIFTRKPHSVNDYSAEMALHLLSQQDVTTRTIGSCNRFCLADYNVCRLQQALVESSFELNNEVLQLFKEHPAYRCFLMLPEYSELSAVNLLNLIVDPRWFNDPLNPHRCNRLYGFLGLTPEGIESLSTTNKHPVTELVAGLWSVQLKRKAINNASGCNWLQRIYYKEKTHDRGLLKATRRLVLYLKLNWLQGLSVQGLQEFCPERFFKNAEEIQAYREIVLEK